MRFVEDGADIPEDLIRSVQDGRAIFLCGAGISARAGLPLFGELTHAVYGHLGESPSYEPAEQEAINHGLYDRALHLLEKRIHRPGTGSPVRGTVDSLLQPPADPTKLADHLDLLKLSRNPEGRPRLLTTNFDTLFERAAHGAGTPIPSHAGKALPDPGRARDWGILHLHGRLADKHLGIDETDLVLTSADFGAAYLRDGWASRYIEQRMRLAPIVLIGYAADDAAMRLLLEALDADRDRFPDLRKIYALDQRSDGSASKWKAKGIEPVEFSDFDSLYRTVSEWARYTMDPNDYQRRRLKEILIG